MNDRFLSPEQSSNNLHLGALMHGGIPGEEHFGFSLHTTKSDEKGDLLLRVTKVDEMIKWMNALAEAAQIDYDTSCGMWNHAAREERNERLAAMEALEKQQQQQEEDAKKKRQQDIEKKMKEQSEELRIQQEQEEELRRKLKEDEERKKKQRESEEDRLRQEKKERMQKIAARKMVMSSTYPLPSVNSLLCMNHLPLSAELVHF